MQILHTLTRTGKATAKWFPSGAVKNVNRESLLTQVCTGCFNCKQWVQYDGYIVGISTTNDASLGIPFEKQMNDGVYKEWRCLQSGVVLSEVLVTVGVVDGLGRVANSQTLTGGLTISPVIGTTVNSEVGGLMNKSSGLGVGTNVWSVPEGTAQVNLSELVGI